MRSRVPDDYVCRNRVQLQLLSDCMDQLVQQLDSLRAESVNNRLGFQRCGHSTGPAR